MRREDAFIILSGWRESNTVISCMTVFGGCSVGLRGRISELNSEEVVIRSSDGAASLTFHFDFIGQFSYSQPKDMLKHMAGSESILSKLSEAEKSASCISMLFPAHPEFQHLGVILNEVPISN